MARCTDKEEEDGGKREEEKEKKEKGRKRRKKKKGDERNKAGYTGTPVACGWAGAIIEVTCLFGQEQ